MAAKDFIRAWRETKNDVRKDHEVVWCIIIKQKWFPNHEMSNESNTPQQKQYLFK